ncbi:oxidoreductase [Phaeosphaeria sp. MPI-PUGE-AT-0046c]|nr:oxidoreductase [Phaeosphaeria sp. MPI-PUGE-AT-0046c]
MHRNTASYLSPAFATRFVATKPAEEVAGRLREDEALINAGEACSWVAWHLPGYNSVQGKDVAAQLAPLPDLSHDVKQLIYENLLNKIRTHLGNDALDQVSNEITNKQYKMQTNLPRSELSIALKVLVHLQDNAIMQPDTPGEAIISWLKEESSPRISKEKTMEESETPIFSTAPRVPRKRRCYICRLAITESYHTHPSMCGTFNAASSLISTPPTLQLPSDFVALVTGARVNLGYHTALRLLRCGARVIATTRYPRDAAMRYLKEEDSSMWRERLKVVGADFRSAADAFALAKETKICLTEWADGQKPTLNVLINNAAQTLTDSLKKEQRAIEHEDTLKGDSLSHGLLIQGTYKARVRGGATPMLMDGTKANVSLIEGKTDTAETTANDMASSFTNDTATTDIEPYSKSSWVQSLFDIPYEDVMSAHAVNTFVPLILIRELLPLMGSTNSSSSTKPRSYIVNVSSREGIFEDRLRDNSKKGHHVHTNMSKAALNMITETEAASAWRSRRVAMNTVDPGYMSAAPEYEDAFDGTRPIGWEDGAGRVLWPIAVGELENRAIWGRFLKHYGAVEVDPGAGRG